MKLVFDLSKSLDKTKLVQVQRTVQGKHGQYQRMQWVKPSDVKDTDKVVGGQDSMEISEKNFPVGSKIYYKGEEATVQRVGKEFSGGGMGIVVRFSKGGTGTIGKSDMKNVSKTPPTKSSNHAPFADASSQPPSASEYGKFMSDANKKLNKDDGYKVVHNNIDYVGYSMTTPSGNKVKIYKDHSGDGYTAAISNGKGGYIHPKDDSGKYIHFKNPDEVKKWIDENTEYGNKKKSKDSVKTDKVPDKALGKTWSDTKTELGKMGYKVDSIFSSQPPQPKEKLILYKDGKEYEAEVTKYHNGDYEILGSSIKEVKKDTDTKKDESDKPKLTDPTTPTNPSDIKVGDYIYYEDNEGAGGIKGVTQVKEIKKVVIPKTGKTMYVFNEHGRHDRVSCLEGKTVKKYDTKSKQDNTNADSSTQKTLTWSNKNDSYISSDGNFEVFKTRSGKWRLLDKSKGETSLNGKGVDYDSLRLAKQDAEWSYAQRNKSSSSIQQDSDNKSGKFSMSEFTGMKSDRTKAIQYLKDNGISWKETDNEGINWMRACMAASRAENPAQGATKKDSASKSSSDTKASGKSTEEAKKAVKDLLSANNNDRAKVMQIAKASGVTWKESDNDGINWMRASLAIQKHHESGKTISASASDDKKDDTKTDDKPSAKKVSISDLKRPASNNTSTNLVAGDYNISVTKLRNVGANAKQHPSFYRIVVEKDGDRVFYTDKTDWSDIKEHAKRYIDSASNSDSKSDRNSDSTSGVKQLKPANISTRDEFDIHSKVRKGELSKTPIGDSDKEMIKNIVPNYKSILKESDTKCVAYSKNREYRFTKLSDSHFKCEVYEISNKKDTSRPIKTSWYETK